MCQFVKDFVCGRDMNILQFVGVTAKVLVLALEDRCILRSKCRRILKHQSEEVDFL